MIRSAHLLLPLAAPLTLGAAPVPPMAFAIVDPQVTILHQRVVIRIPRMSVAAPARVKPLAWKEHKGPKCVDPEDLAGAMVSAPAVVDLLLVDGSRLRARLDKECRSADFYAGLYMKPGADGRICADRDAIRVRSGTRCEIANFRRLTLSR